MAAPRSRMIKMLKANQTMRRSMTPLLPMFVPSVAARELGRIHRNYLLSTSVEPAFGQRRGAEAGGPAISGPWMVRRAVA